MLDENGEETQIQPGQTSNTNSVDDADIVMSPPPVITPTSPPAVTITQDQEDFPPPPPVTPPSDSAQEVTSYSSGDTEVQQMTDTMDNMTLPVGGMMVCKFVQNAE